MNTAKTKQINAGNLARFIELAADLNENTSYCGVLII
jgi:hypothetical protein